MSGETVIRRRNFLAGTAAVGLLPLAGGGAWAQAFRGGVLTEWIGRLERRATELDATPSVPVTRVGAGSMLQKGATGDRVARLAERLRELGVLVPGERVGVFDETVDGAVRAFQERQGLSVDGVVGDGTRAALDRDPADAARAMRQSAVAMRGFSERAPADVLIVNLPSQTVMLVRGDELIFVMRAVVGRPSRGTPLLEDQVTHVVVNPAWTVPPTVLKEDKLPLLRARGVPGIDHAVIYLDGEVVAPETVDWSEVSPGRVRIVQQPGDHNALGRFLFSLTNPQNIFLHGTNEPYLFSRDVRTISSGCVRLESARKLAEILLADAGIGPERIDRMLARGETQGVRLPRPIPVRFVYWRATVDADGSVRVHPDVYDRADEARSARAGT
jgi:murein L,D-transpeptidase YcbB/YkuD